MFINFFIAGFLSLYVLIALAAAFFMADFHASVPPGSLRFKSNDLELDSDDLELAISSSLILLIRSDILVELGSWSAGILTLRDAMFVPVSFGKRKSLPVPSACHQERAPGSSQPPEQESKRDSFPTLQWQKFFCCLFHGCCFCKRKEIYQVEIILIFNLVNCECRYNRFTMLQ